MSVVLACDLGSTSFRAALVGEDGTTRAQHVIGMTTQADSSGRAEIDPALWWNALCDSVEALAVAAPDDFAGIAAIAISGITRSQVLVDTAGVAVAPAILWNDTRASETLATLVAQCPPEHPETAGLNAFHPLARLFWLKAAHPDLFARVRHVFDPKDYLNFRLTGAVVSDPVSLARLLAAAVTPASSGITLFDAAGLSSTLIPAMREPVSVMGRITAGHGGALAQLAGAPVVTMANDTWASVVGLGAMRPGFGYNLSGTTEVLGLVSADIATAEGLLTVDWREGLTQLGGPSQSGGDTLAWLLALLGATDRNAAGTLETLLAAPRDADPVLFLPYLQGERVPYWDTALRGALVGLNRRHRAVDLAYAVMEGVGFLNRIVLERAEAAAARPVSEIRFGGGGSANPRWCQIKADILDRPISVIDHGEVGLLGAAIASFTAIGRFASLVEAQERLVRVRTIYAPEARNHAEYDRLFALFRDTEAALVPISRRLAGWRGGERA